MLHKNICMKFSLTSLLAVMLVFVISTSCAQESNNQNPEPNNGTITVVEAFPNLSFTRPVDLQHSGDNSDRIFVVEQRGVISVFSNDAEVADKSVFLDIESRVKDQGNEEGLLGLAFHPNYENNGYFYVNYTAEDPNRTVISRFQVSSADQNSADEGSEFVLLEFNQPFSNHNGGQVAFGPDGYLYIAVGDGGSGGDPQGHGQNRETLLATLLRIDVDNPSGQMNYSIPADNPFAGNQEGYREEIYAYGLRNPWRFSFDTENDRLWTGDVGQNSFEEINIVEKGKNYGWKIMEGFHCFEPSTGCDQEGLELPIWEYDRSQGDVSITGGFVYRGPTMQELEGLYVYADYVSGRIWTLDHSNLNSPVNNELIKASFPISSFGTDQNNELYLCGFDGKIYKFGYE